MMMMVIIIRSGRLADIITITVVVPDEEVKEGVEAA